MIDQLSMSRQFGRAASVPRDDARNLALWGVLLLIILSPLDPYRIEFGGMHWSPQRLAMVVYMPVFGMYLLTRRRLPFRLAHLFVLGIPFSVLVSMIAPDLDYGLFRKYAVIDLFNAILFWVIYQVSSERWENRRAVAYAFGVSALLYLAYALYTGYMLWVSRQPIIDPPFANAISFVTSFSSEEARLQRMYYLRRFCLPFSVPQALGYVSGLLSFVFVVRWVSDSRRLWVFLAGAMVALMLLTFSRSAIFAVALGYGVVVWRLAVARGKINSTVVKMVIVWMAVMILIVVLSRMGYDLPLDRLVQFGSTDNNLAHYEIRKLALDVWLNQPLLKQMTGIGVGNFSRVGEAWKAHMTYTNVLVERGVVGFVSSCTIFMALPIVFWLRCRRDRRRENVVWLGAGLTIFMANAFYSFFGFTALWMLYAYLCAEAWPTGLPAHKRFRVTLHRLDRGGSRRTHPVFGARSQRSGNVGGES